MPRGPAAFVALVSASLALAGGALGDANAAGDAAFVDFAQVQGKADFTSDPGGTIAPTATTVYPVQQVDVPAPQGFDLVGAVSERHYALVDDVWLSTRVHNLLVSLKIPPDAVAIFVTDSAFLYVGSPSVCCIVGYHGAASSASGNGKQQVNTYIYAAYSDQGVFKSPKLADVHA